MDSLPDAGWSKWLEPRQTSDGPESPYDHALVEVRREGETASSTIDPATRPVGSDCDGIWWRPMIWATEGARARKVYAGVLAAVKNRG